MKKNLIIFIIIIIINLIATFSSDFATWYSTYMSKFYANTIGRFFSPVLFSVFEFVVIGLILGLIIIIFKYRSLTLILRYLLIIILIFSLTTGINYHRKPLNDQMDFKIVSYDNQDLLKLYEYLTSQLENLTVKEIDNNKIENNAIKAMNNLIPGYYPKPKPMFFSKLMTMCGLSGIFSPFTIEANYNQDMPQYQKPFTILHELSHLAGYMSEDEANFLGYLACINDDNSYFKYSGYLTAFVYVGNALAKNNVDISSYYQRLPANIINDLKKNNQFWHQYGDTLSSISDAVNDTYLKMNSINEGIDSYSMFVDLLYSYYLSLQTR